MKNFILIAVAIFFSVTTSFAQNAKKQTQPVKGNQPKAVSLKPVAAKPGTGEARQTTNPTKSVSAQENSSVQVKQATPAQAKEEQSKGPVLKKDGTPDKRYKENQKLKKDGTPDKRYKENKPSEKQK
jgi:hypothetical protein